MPGLPKRTQINLLAKKSGVSHFFAFMGAVYGNAGRYGINRGTVGKRMPRGHFTEGESKSEWTCFTSEGYGNALCADVTTRRSAKHSHETSKTNGSLFCNVLRGPFETAVKPASITRLGACAPPMPPNETLNISKFSPPTAPERFLRGYTALLPQSTAGTPARIQTRWPRPKRC